MSPWQTNIIDEALFELALNEDLGIPWQDVTTDLLFPQLPAQAEAKIFSKHKEPIRICGISFVAHLLTKLSRHSQVLTDFQDGEELPVGATMLTILTDPHSLLKAERILLNFLRHSCAISTLTAQYASQVKHTNLKILDTRKTTPGLRHLEKYAVYCGGGQNHRMGLYDAVMIKDTHIDLLGGMEKALEKLPLLTSQSLPVIVEVRSLEELNIVLEKGQSKVHRVLLDNMNVETLAACVKACRGIFETEASGNIRLDSIVKIAETGVDFASIGELTYGAGHVDLSMRTSFMSS